jgi:DNA-directed RNA polymerase subunit RPC12/RpoP
MRKLVCVECGKRASKHATGWWALIPYEPDHEPKLETVYVFCPECAERKFDPSR